MRNNYLVVFIIISIFLNQIFENYRIFLISLFPISYVLSWIIENNKYHKGSEYKKEFKLAIGKSLLIAFILYSIYLILKLSSSSSLV